MKQTINFSQFVDAFWDTYKGNFTYAGKRALFDYLEEYEDSTDEEVELDIVALCCEYAEYESAWDAMLQYQAHDMPNCGEGGELGEVVEGDDLIEVDAKCESAARAWLENKTTVIDVEGGGVIIAQF